MLTAVETRMLNMHPKIVYAAVHVAAVLARGETASFNLDPGDFTRYPLIVRPPGEVEEIGGTVYHKEYLVVLCSSFGAAYPWAGQAMHWDYCAAKWTHDRQPRRERHEWTGRVMAAFLTALAAEIARPS